MRIQVERTKGDPVFYVITVVHQGVNTLLLTEHEAEDLLNKLREAISDEIRD